MDAKQYLELSSRTVSNDYSTIATRMVFTDGDSQKSIDLMHAVLGLVTESAEMAFAVQKEESHEILLEAGDCLWYVALLLRTLGMTFDDIQSKRDTTKFVGYWGDMTTYTDEIMQKTADLVDILKKHIFYGKKAKEADIQEILMLILIYLGFVLDLCGSDVGIEMQRNIDKLTVRFPDKFESDQAIDKDAKEEERLVF